MIAESTDIEALIFVGIDGLVLPGLLGWASERTRQEGGLSTVLALDKFYIYIYIYNGVLST